MNGKRSPLKHPRGANRPKSRWKIPATDLKKAGVTCGVFVLASVMLAACGSSSAHGKGMTITLYSGQHVQTTDALVPSFEKSNPNINVAVRSNDEDTFDAQIVAEGSRSRSSRADHSGRPPKWRARHGHVLDTEFYGHDAVIKLRADFDGATTLVVRTSNAADLPVRDAQVSLEIRGGVVAWPDAPE